MPYPLTKKHQLTPSSVKHLFTLWHLTQCAIAGWSVFSGISVESALMNCGFFEFKRSFRNFFRSSGEVESMKCDNLTLEFTRVSYREDDDDDDVEYVVSLCPLDDDVESVMIEDTSL